MLEAMEVSGVSKGKRYLIYYALRKFGAHWEIGSNFATWPAENPEVDLADLRSFYEMAKTKEFTADQIDELVQQ